MLYCTCGDIKSGDKIQEVKKGHDPGRGELNYREIEEIKKRREAATGDAVLYMWGQNSPIVQLARSLSQRAEAFPLVSKTTKSKAARRPAGMNFFFLQDMVISPHVQYSIPRGRPTSLLYLFYLPIVHVPWAGGRLPSLCLVNLFYPSPAGLRADLKIQGIKKGQDPRPRGPEL